MEKVIKSMRLRKDVVKKITQYGLKNNRNFTNTVETILLEKIESIKQ